MRTAALLACALLAMPAAHGADYAHRIELAIPGAQFAYRVKLPDAVHRGATRADLADLRVVNAAGEPVPFGFAGGAGRADAPADSVALPLFPVTRALAASAGDFELKVRRNADGSVVALASAAAPRAADAREVAFWLADLSRLPRGITGLAFDWRTAPGLAAAARIEAGDDLRTWRTLAGRAPLLDLAVGGERLRRDAVEFAATRARYLRIHIEREAGPAPEGLALRATLAAPDTAPPRERIEAAGARAPDQPLEVAFDLGGLWPVDRVEFRLPQPNTLVPAELLVRDRTDEPWRALARTVVYRIDAAGAQADSPALALPATTARHWLLRADARSGGFGTGELRLVAGYAARHLVFVARGSGPFRVEYGRRTAPGARDAASAALPLATLLPDYRAGAEWALAEATPGAALTVDAAAAAPSLANTLDLRKATLWGLLVAAVGLLGFIAWRLLRGAAPDA